MPVEKIESIMAGLDFKFEKAADNRWKILSGGNLKYPAYVELARRPSSEAYVKIYTPVGRLPQDANSDFYRDIFRKSRDMGHGAFALAGEDTMVFVDTLEASCLDANEFEATMTWLAKSIDIYKEKLDSSKLPYLDAF